MRSSRIGATPDHPRLRIADRDRGVAHHNLALETDGLEAMAEGAHPVDHAARDQVFIEDAAGNRGFAGRELLAADEKTRLLDRGLRTETAIEHAGEDLVHRG